MGFPARGRHCLYRQWSPGAPVWLSRNFGVVVVAQLMVVLCLLSELYLGTDEYRNAMEEAVEEVKRSNGYTAKDIANAQARVDRRLRDDGPCAEFLQLPMFKKYAMATFLVLISSAIIEGKFSEFLGLKSTHRSSMCDSNVSSCLSTRVAKPVHDDPAKAFNPDPELADMAREHRLDWWDEQNE